jgi:hypothetical protein
VKLWDDFREHICNDLDHQLRRMGFENPPDSDIYDYGLFLLNKNLQDAGHFLADFGMPELQRDWTVAVENPLVAEQLDYDPAEQRARATDNFDRMNDEQQFAFNRIIESVEQKQGKVFSSVVQVARGRHLSITPSHITSAANPASFYVLPPRELQLCSLLEDTPLTPFSRFPLMASAMSRHALFPRKVCRLDCFDSRSLPSGTRHPCTIASATRLSTAPSVISWGMIVYTVG